MPDNFSNNRRIAKNTIFLAIRMVIVLCIALYVSRVTLRVLGVEDYGIYNVVCGFVSMFTFLNAAMTTGIQRFFNYEFGKNGEEGANKVFVMSLYTQAALALIIVLLLESVGLWYMYEKMVIPAERFTAAMWIFQFSVISTVVMMFQVPYDAAILAHEKMSFYAFLSILNQVLKLIIVLSLAYIPGDNLIVYGVLFLGVTCVDFLLNYVYSHIHFKEVKFRKVFYKDLFKELLTFSGWNVFGKFAIIMREQGLNMVLNLFFGPVVNAARGLAFQVTGALEGFVSNINVAVKPQLTQSYAQGDTKRTSNLMFTASKLCAFTLLLLSLPVCLEIDFILNLWLGEGNVPEFTNVFIVIVIMTKYVGSVGTLISFVVHATGEMKEYQVVTSLVELLLIPFAYFALKNGAPAPAVFILSFIFTCINIVVSLFILRKIFPVSLIEYFKNVALPLFFMTCSAIAIPLLIRFSMNEGWARVVLVLIVSVISSLASFYLIGLMPNEKRLVRNYVKLYIGNKIKKI